jgi:hypothetical protein
MEEVPSTFTSAGKNLEDSGKLEVEEKAMPPPSRNIWLCVPCPQTCHALIDIDLHIATLTLIASCFVVGCIKVHSHS